MAAFRLRDIGAEYPVPDGQGKAVVAVMLGPKIGMVHAVHVRRYQKLPQERVQPTRKPDVSVVEQSRTVEDDLENQDAEGRWTDQVDQPDLEQHGKRDFHGVKADRGAHIEVAVGMMDTVKTPQDRHLVGDKMLRPDCEIKDQYRCQYRQPC